MQSRGRGAVPVLLVRLDGDAVTGTNGLDGSAAALDEADAFSDEQTLPERMSVPGSPGTGHEVDKAGHGTRRVRGARDGVDVDITGEPLGWPFPRAGVDR